ncbi:(deoxy)nucleoside triphosphate pyrophosphohydrolase [Parapedobacter sp. DT-150]|uniref:(deoxy)nucleoside triphosphate pyrophosphohydrolase n=1 Tax=Parapedobacter sp. DT-150 TaxID=3396162 RepID=UPI003F1C65F8
MPIPHYQVVAAIIQHDGKILCVQKGVHKYPYISHKYEFPGGKVESGESHQAALQREIHEELHLDIHVGDPYHTVTHAYPDFSITLEAYLCVPMRPYTLQLIEHIHHQWLSPAALLQLDWAAADLPIVAKLTAATGRS